MSTPPAPGSMQEVPTVPMIKRHRVVVDSSDLDAPPVPRRTRRKPRFKKADQLTDSVQSLPKSIYPSLERERNTLQASSCPPFQSTSAAPKAASNASAKPGTTITSYVWWPPHVRITNHHQHKRSRSYNHFFIREHKHHVQ